MLQVIGYILGGLFICGAVVVFVVNLIGLIRDIKQRKKSKKGE